MTSEFDSKGSQLSNLLLSMKININKAFLFIQSQCLWPTIYPLLGSLISEYCSMLSNIFFLHHQFHLTFKRYPISISEFRCF